MYSFLVSYFNKIVVSVVIKAPSQKTEKQMKICQPNNYCRLCLSDNP